jgi:hypothetical protein
MRQKIRRLVQQVDAQLVLRDADMDVQPADREAPPDALQIVLETRVAAAFGGLLGVPTGEGMRCRGNRCHAVTRRDRSYRPTQPPKISARLVEIGAHPRSDLDLRTQKFRADLPRK